MRNLLLALNDLGYEHITRPLIFRLSAQDAHYAMLRFLGWLDGLPQICRLLGSLQKLTFHHDMVTIGGVALPHRFILAAGFVKGQGFASETEALKAVECGENIMPGWHSMPALVGVVEFGSFTRWPRPGNAGTAMWRDNNSRSTQNRVGLRNPGAVAAATFLAHHAKQLPPIFGINIAVSPGISDPTIEIEEVIESLRSFLDKGIHPSWFTLNISCPNTEDDPKGHQTETRTQELCQTVINFLTKYSPPVPLWVKISPELSAAQYEILMRVFAQTGVKAIIATNTLPCPSPDNKNMIAGVGGDRLHPAALEAVRLLVSAQQGGIYPVDIIGCGGVIDGQSYADYRIAGVQAVQYWSALVYRGPLAAASIESEYQRGRFANHYRESAPGN
jgi:dihydroorotate dehydrogenase